MRGDPSRGATHVWFSVGGGADLQGLSVDLYSLIKNYVLPLLDQLNNFEAIAQHLERQSGGMSKIPEHHLNMAVILHAIGKHDESTAILRETYDASSKWSERYIHIARELGVELDPS